MEELVAQLAVLLYAANAQSAPLSNDDRRSGPQRAVDDALWFVLAARKAVGK